METLVLTSADALRDIVLGAVTQALDSRTLDDKLQSVAAIEPNRGLTFDEAAERIGVSGPTFRAMLRRGDLPYQRIGVKWVIPSDAVDTFLRGGL